MTDSLNIIERILGPLHFTTITVLNNLAIIYQGQGKEKEAEQLFLHVLNHSDNIQETGSPSTAITLHNLAQLYRQQGNYNKAEQTLLHSLSILEAPNTTYDSPEAIDLLIAGTLDALAAIYQLQNKAIDEVEPLYKRSLHIKEQLLGPEHPDVAITLHDWAMLLSDSEPRLEEGKKLFERAIHLSRLGFGPNSFKAIQYEEDYYDIFPAED
ncbi:tetratricopeptide repeat protein [Dictyobacter formicarum]|uniref:Tetratricopeptide repeat protein n=1 Tax=Dictyobacter formicarum TaxID=2778368 RepID=A0ABQ3VQU1_9CHLR|nr:tetratricopeptide repeat protein [Dictyobacter formicarum]GHO88059.1 hypothetical protein KSZ_60650 [Dictyobacter formicarum]